MNLFEVMAKISLDSSGYEKGLAKAKKSSNEYKKDVMNLAQTYKKQGMSMSDAMKKAYSEIDKSQYDMSNNSKKTTSQIGADWKGLSSKLAGVASKTGEAVKVVADKIGTAVKTGMKVAGGAAAAFGVSAIKTGMDFDAAMSQVAATMGKTTDEVKDLRAFAQKMGESTKFSATEAAEALNYMALAGYDSNKSMKMLPNVLNLAAAGNIDLASASDMVTDAQSALGLNMKQTNKMVDQMAAASSKSNTSVSQLGDAMLTVGATARSIRGGTREISTILGVLADNNMKGAEGGTHLRNMLVSLQTPTKSGTAALKKLNMTYNDMYDSSGKLRSLPEIFVEMQGKMEGMTQRSKDAIVSGLFNKYDLSAANALLGTSKDRFDELSESIKKSGGAAEKMAGTQLDNLSGDVTYLKSAFEGLQIAVSDKVSPALRKFVQAGTGGISELTAAVKSGNLGNVFNVIADGVSKASTKMENAGAEIMNGIMSGIEKHSKQVANNVLYLVASWAINLRKKASDFVDAGIKFAESIASGLAKSTPVFSKSVPTIISNIAGIVADNAPKIVTSLTNGIQKYYPKLLETAWNAAVKLSDGLRKGASNLVDAGLKLIMALADGIIKNIPTLIKTVPTIISNLAGIINDNAPKLIVAGATIIVKLAKGIIDSIPTLVAEFPKIVKAIIDVWTAVNWMSLGKTLITGIVNGVKNLSTTIPNAIKDIATKAVNGFKSINWAATGKAVITTLKTAVSGAANLVVNALKTIGTNAINAFKEVNWANVGKAVINLIKNAATSAGTGVVTTVKTIGTKAITAFKGVNWADVGKAAINFIKNAISNAGSNIVNALKTVGNNAKNAFKSIDWAAVGKAAINFIKNAISGTGNIIINALRTIGRNGINAFKSVDWAAVGKATINLIANAIRGAANLVISGLRTVASSAMNAFKSIDWRSVGVNIIRGIAAGITGGLSTIVNAAKSAAQSALNAAKNALDIHSPSKAAREQVGLPFVQGIAEGIRKNKKYAESSAKEVSEAILQTAEKRLANTKVYNDVSLKQEVEYWNAVRKETQKGTQARIDADAKYKETLKSYREEVKKTITDAQNLSTSFSQSFSEINDNLEKSIAETKQKYIDALEQRANGLESSIKIFEQFQKADLPKYTEIVGIDENGEKITKEVTANSDILINNLKAQVDAIHEWNSVLGSLTDKLGGNNPLLKQFESMGTDSYETLKLINDMTDEQLNTYVDLYNQYASEAMLRAKEENKSLKEQTKTDVASLKEDAKQKIKTLKDQYAKDLAELAKNSKSNGEKVGSSISKGVSKGIKGTASEVKEAAKMITQKVLNIKPDAKISGEAVGESMARGAANSVKNNSNKVIEAVRTITGRVKESSSEAKSSGKSIGEYIAQGIEKGIKDGESSIKAAARQAARGAYNSAKNELDINSPSKKFLWIGKMIDNGLALGINKNTDSVDNAISNLSNITQFPNPSNLSTATATVSGGTTGNNVTTITMNIYGAQGQDVKALADEVERRLNAKVTRGGVAFA